MTDKPVFTDQFYIDKFMEIQQQNILLYKALLLAQQNTNIRQVIEKELGKEFFNILKECPA
jgi:hypothetical protein